MATVADSRTPDVGLPPAALARHADLERRRELARALHAPPVRARSIIERLDQMAAQIALYRAQAIALHARLKELEAAGPHNAYNDNVAELRRRLIESSVAIIAIESITRSIVTAEPTRFARGTESIDALNEWNDQPTLRRAR
jgi:hypothetical protein